MQVLAVQNTSIGHPWWNNLQEPWDNLQEPWDNLQVPGTFTFRQTNTFRERPRDFWPLTIFDIFWHFLTIFDTFMLFDNFHFVLTILDNFVNTWQLKQFWTVLTISENFDIFWQCWQFWHLDLFKTFSDNFDNDLPSLTIIDQFC